MQHPTEGLKVDSIIAPCHPAWSGVTKKPATSTDWRTLLADPEALPFRDIRTIDRQRVLIVAPHPDDETLGCGGAISLLCRQGYDVNVPIVSDGTGSHPNSQKYPAPILRWIRSQETLTALAILGKSMGSNFFTPQRWCDSHRNCAQVSCSQSSLPQIFTSNLTRYNFCTLATRSTSRSSSHLAINSSSNFELRDDATSD